MSETTAPRTLVAVRGLANTTPAFRWKLVSIADALGVDPNFLATVMSMETMGTFSPKVKNPFSGAVGLIQFMPSTAAALHTTTAALAAMTAERQLDYVRSYFERALGGRRVTELRDVYLAVFAPAFVLAPSGTVVFTKGKDGDRYEGNKNLDKDGDGKITVDDVALPVEAILKEGLKHPPIVVTEPRDEIASGGSTAAFLLGLAGIALWLYNTKFREVHA